MVRKISAIFEELNAFFDEIARLHEHHGRLYDAMNDADFRTEFPQFVLHQDVLVPFRAATVQQCHELKHIHLPLKFVLRLHQRLAWL